MKANREWGILAIILSCVIYGCASSGDSLGEILVCEDPYLRMWSVVQAVVSSMGGKVVVADQNGGMLMATLPGTGVRLYVEITGSPGGGTAFPGSVTVTVKAVNPRDSERDRFSSDFLESIEKLFLEEVAARALCLKPLKLGTSSGISVWGGG